MRNKNYSKYIGLYDRLIVLAEDKAKVIHSADTAIDALSQALHLYPHGNFLLIRVTCCDGVTECEDVTKDIEEEASECLKLLAEAVEKK